MPRDHRRGVGRPRGSWTLRIAGTALVVLAAAVVTSILLLAHSRVQARRDTPPSLSSKVVSALTVGLVNPGPTTAQDPVPARRMLRVSSGSLIFTTVTGTAQASSLEQW